MSRGPCPYPTTRNRRLAANPETDFWGSAARGAGADSNEEDHYALLGVPFTATHAEITRAYRRAMKRAHPDRQHPARRGAAEELARRLNEAHAILTNPSRRQAYDRTIRQQVIQDQIMRRYVGGFQNFDVPGAARAYQRREPTAAERRERAIADRQASMILVLVAVAVTAFFLLALIFGSLLGSLVDAVR